MIKVMEFKNFEKPVTPVTQQQTTPSTRLVHFVFQGVKDKQQ